MYSEDGAVSLDINEGLCYSLNPVGQPSAQSLRRYTTESRVLSSMSELIWK
jgi:hypothetical protein